MTKQTYLLWKVSGQIRFKSGERTAKVKYDPGRESQLLRLIARWELEDGTMPLPDDEEATHGEDPR